MFQDVEDAIKALQEIKVYSEDLAQLSSFLLKTLTDEEFAEANVNSDDLLNRKLLEDIVSCKDGIIKHVNKLKRL